MRPVPAVNVLPCNVAMLAVLFVTTAPTLSALPNAVANSFNVSSEPSAPSTKLVIAASTYSVVAAMLLPPVPAT